MPLSQNIDLAENGRAESGYASGHLELRAHRLPSKNVQAVQIVENIRNRFERLELLERLEPMLSSFQRQRKIALADIHLAQFFIPAQLIDETHERLACAWVFPWRSGADHFLNRGFSPR